VRLEYEREILICLPKESLFVKDLKMTLAIATPNAVMKLYA